MRIIYDISVLGAGYYANRARTGIARVIENVALHLVRSNACEMDFCAYHSVADVVQSFRYLETAPELRRVPLVPVADRTARAVTDVVRRFYPGPSRRLPYRVLRRAIAILLNGFGPGFAGIDPGVLASADIFHATFYPIPAFARTYSAVKRFVTVYDLIPILHPEFFSFKEDHLLHDVMKSITPDDWVIAISQSTKNDLCGYLKFDPDRVFVTHLAASELFHPCTDRDAIARARMKYGIPEGPYVLSLCTLEPRKNIDHTIQCFARMVEEQRIPDLNLVLVGTKGWDFDRIFGEISKQGRLRERIAVTGYMADDDLAAVYSGATMFVYPSFYEGFGLPPLEAMQCGVPAITSNTSSLPEVVGDAGLMVDPKDGDALCQAMYDVYRQPSYREKLSRLSLERAAAFSWEKCARETLGAYQTAIRSSS